MAPRVLVLAQSAASRRWHVICIQAEEGMRIFAAALREKYESMVFIRQVGEFSLVNL
jgi:hypothetical protein